jgi:hypothetical protein
MKNKILSMLKSRFVVLVFGTVMLSSITIATPVSYPGFTPENTTVSVQPYVYEVPASNPLIPTINVMWNATSMASGVMATVTLTGPETGSISPSSMNLAEGKWGTFNVTAPSTIGICTYTATVIGTDGIVTGSTTIIVADLNFVYPGFANVAAYEINQTSPQPITATTSWPANTIIGDGYDADPGMDISNMTLTGQTLSVTPDVSTSFLTTCDLTFDYQDGTNGTNVINDDTGECVVIVYDDSQETLK